MSSAFFLPPHSQRTNVPYLLSCYQSESAKAYPLPTERPGAEDAFTILEGAPLPKKSPSLGRDRLQGFSPEPPGYSTRQFSLNRDSMDQLDVLLTSRQYDHNYSSLAAFLEHRPFCSLLVAMNKDGSLQLPGLPNTYHILRGTH